MTEITSRYRTRLEKKDKKLLFYICVLRLMFRCMLQVDTKVEGIAVAVLSKGNLVLSEEMGEVLSF